MFNSIISGGINIENFAACLATAFALGLVVAFVHMKTTHSNRNFITTLAILPILVTTVILMVNGNLGTGVAVMGAFSLVRFRSIPGNSRAILSVFFAMAIGLAVGTGYLAFAAIFTIAVAIITATLSFINFGAGTTQEKKLTVLVPEDLDYTTVFDKAFNKYLNGYTLEKAKTTNLGSLFELTYRINLKKGTSEKEFIDTLRERNGNLKVALSHTLAEEEL
ncbi:DUF4956 domain-containing protein [Candidatus Saccharibacteria bacterium]|nr:DUF4956 domain-containing protein [Candidatus Saccharibacteria bacterium]